MGVSTRTLGLCLVWVGIGANLSRAFGIAPKFASSTPRGFGIRPRVLTLTSRSVSALCKLKKDSIESNIIISRLSYKVVCSYDDTVTLFK